MIKVFTQNKDGKIELTKAELKSLLDESYWEGYEKGKGKSYWTYTYPSWAYTSPYTWTTSSSGCSTLTSNDTATNTTAAINGGLTATTVSGCFDENSGTVTIKNQEK